MTLGAQLYTIREFTQTTEALAETLAKVAEIGYTSVQVSGTCAFDADWLNEQLKINGLVCPVTHTSPDKIADDTDTAANEHIKFGCGICGIGAAPGIWDQSFVYEDFKNRFLPAANKFKTYGLRLGYHNHHMEFNKTDGKNFLERMAEDFPSDTLTFILDTYWIQYSGGDPAQWIRKFSGRVHCVHFKDMAIVGNEQRMACVGGGNINFNSAISACEDAGTEFILVEQDDCYGENPFGCLAESYNYLKSFGLK